MIDSFSKNLLFSFFPKCLCSFLTFADLGNAGVYPDVLCRWFLALTDRTTVLIVAETVLTEHPALNLTAFVDALTQITSVTILLVSTLAVLAAAGSVRTPEISRHHCATFTLF